MKPMSHIELLSKNRSLNASRNMPDESIDFQLKKRAELVFLKHNMAIYMKQNK